MTLKVILNNTEEKIFNFPSETIFDVRGQSDDTFMKLELTKETSDVMNTIESKEIFYKCYNNILSNYQNKSISQIQLYENDFLIFDSLKFNIFPQSVEFKDVKNGTIISLEFVFTM